LDVDKILNEWNQYDSVISRLNKMKKTELVVECEKDGYKSTGSKQELITFIMDKVTAPPLKESFKTPKKTQVSDNIVQKIQTACPTLVIRRNEHGNYEHSETMFIFNHKTKKVVGKQSDTTNDILTLTKEDIVICEKFNFDYVIPESLGTTSSGNTDIIDELTETELTMVDEIDESDEDIEY
jgi:hypothetical protein